MLTKQCLVVAILFVGLTWALEETDQAGQSGSPLSELHTSLFFVQAEPQETEATLEQLKAAKELIEASGDPERLFSDSDHSPDVLIGLWSSEQTCNPERAHEISQLIDRHRATHGTTNVVEYLVFARRNQLASCTSEQVQSKLAKIVGESLDSSTQLELPSVEKFVASLTGDQLEVVMNEDKLPAKQVVPLVVGYLKHSGKSPKFVARVLNDKHIKQVVDKAVALLERINQAYQADLGHFDELSKDSFAWQKLGQGERSKILLGRFCQLAANAGDDLREQVDEALPTGFSF